MRILVIGSEGTIGRELVPYLQKDPANQVIRCDRIRNKADDYVMADITHYETLIPAFEPAPDLVFHLAGEVSRETAEHWPNIAIENNVLGAQNVVRLCLEKKAKLLYAGTSEEYGDLFFSGQAVTEEMRPINQQGIYGLTKWLAEELIEYHHRRYGLNAVIVRIFMCYGPGELPNPYRSAVSRFIEWARKNEPLQVHKGGERSWCFVDDTIRGLVAAAAYDKKPFEIFNIGIDEPVDMEMVAKEIIRLTNSSSKIILQEAPAGITLIKRASFKKAEQVLGWKAEVGIKEGLRRTVEWQLANVKLELCGQK